MRRLLRGIADGREISETTTLANPFVVSEVARGFATRSAGRVIAAGGREPADPRTGTGLHRAPIETVAAGADGAPSGGPLLPQLTSAPQH